MTDRRTDRPATLGALRASGYRPRPVKQEIRANLRAVLAAGGRLFPGIVGYERTVIPEIVNALLSGHDFILLGLRGQAKTRILRALTDFLDDAVPVLEGCELNDDPLAPISVWGQRLVAGAGRRRCRSSGSRATSATARSWPRPTSRSPTSSATSTRSRRRTAG